MQSRFTFKSGAQNCFLTVAFTIIAASTAFAQQSQPTPTPAPSATPARRAARPIPPPRYIPPHDYDQRNIKLDLRFDWGREQAIGTETITLAPVVKDLRRVDFDAAYMSVSGVALASGTALKFEYDATKEKLTVLLDRAYQPADELTLVISYHTNQPPPEKRAGLGGGGLNFIKPRPDDPTRPRQVWSQGEAEANHLWFACFDHPNDFVTSEVIATVEKPLTVISNGKLISMKDNPDGTRTFDWKIDDPHATYLTSIIVGEFAPIIGTYADIAVITNVYTNEIDEGVVTAARLPEMVKFFSEKTGVKYPYAKYAQTTVRDFGGGMENISATTQTDNMIHDARAELDQTADSLESHELAHQWFGDYVTCRTWSDIWLNESFATYFQAMWDEHHLGHDDFLYLDVKANQDQYYQAWGRGQRRPIVTKNYTNPDAVFDTYAYPRGGAVLHMLRTFLGEDNWWRSINHYLTKYAHQPVETEQLRIAIEETTGQPMDWFFDEWVYKMGHPVFRVTQDYDAANKALTLIVRQEQHPDPDSQYPQVTYFQTPVDIEIATATGKRVERVQIDPKEEQTIKLAVDSEPLLVNFDYGDTLIKELVFSKTTGQLLYQLAHDQDVLGRIWALQQLSARMNDANTTGADRRTIIKAIGDAATKDQFWGARLEAVTALNGLKDAKALLLTAIKDANARVRARAINSLAATKDASLADAYRQLLGDQSYAVIRAAAAALGQTKSPAAYDALMKIIDMPSWRDTIRASALIGLAALGDKRALDLGFKYFAAGNPNGVRAAAVGLLGATGKDDARIFPLISAALTDTIERRNFALFAGEADALVALGDERGLALFQELSKKPGTPPQLVAALSGFESRLRAKLAPKPNP
ncbi:MAG TPA: M1 family aminopeptidase [Pyrinomonadaceae bacterium]|nr:M1 family aminopeptidase [Pyrinomonadaceae bacterium]